jgi:hypothetical protein
MSVILATSSGVGFSAGFNRNDSIPVSVSIDTPQMNNIIDVTVTSLVSALFSVSSLVRLQSMEKAIASGFLRLSVKVYQVSKDAAIPSDFSTLSAIMTREFQIGYESNLYSGRADERFTIPMLAGRYLISVTISNTVHIPKQPIEQHLLVADHVDIIGTPAQDASSQLVTIADAMANMSSVMTSLSNTVSGITSKIDVMNTKLDTLHTDLS